MQRTTLSARETEVAGFYIEGLSYKEIARALDISPGTVRTHLNSIYRKLEVSSRTELMRSLQPASPEPLMQPVQTAEDSCRAPKGPERRQVTFLFADIVGSTELASRLDTEEMRDLLTRFRSVVQEILERFRGHAAGFPGDCAIAVFGWPEASEAAPSRAASAALAIASATKTISAAPGWSLAVRVGLSSGIVIVEGGDGRADDFTGAAANLAARLQAVAPPGGVVVSDLTRELIGGSFEMEALGATELRGIREPVPIFRLLRERSDLTRFQIRHHVGRSSPLLGREAQLRVLHDFWSDASEGRGGSVLLVGEAGIGKSRLAESLAGHAEQTGAAILRLQTAEGMDSSALWPVRDVIANAAELDPDAPRLERLARLKTWLEHVSNAGSVQQGLVAFLLNLIGVDDLPEMSAARRRADLLSALVKIFLDLSRQQPVFVLLEDVHWIDPSTLEFAERLLQKTAAASLLFVMTSRPVGAPAFNETAVLRIDLPSLNASDAERLVRERAGDAAIDAETVAAIIARTDGIPLYLEEVTLSVLDGATRRDAVPASLRESLTARLDRIGSAREMAQMAAAIGRDVELDLLKSVAIEEGASRIEADVARLIDAGLASVDGRRIKFSHALVQDAAYQSLLRSQRQDLHARIAEAMLGRFRNRYGSEPETLGHHLEQAGRTAAAVDYFLRAADMSAARAANREAEGYARRALELSETLDGGSERDRREVAALLCLGRALTTRFGYGRPEVAETLRRALDLCRTSGMQRREFPLVVALTAQSGVSGHTLQSLEFAERAATLADASGDPTQRVMAHYAMGLAKCWRGDRREAAIAFGKGRAEYEPDMHSSLLAQGPQDSGLVCLARGAANSYLVAPCDEFIERMDKAVILARKLGHSHTLNYVLHWNAMQAIDALQWERAESALEETMALAEEHGFATWLTISSMLSARFASARHSPSEAYTAARYSLELLPQGGNLSCVSLVRGLLADALRRLGRRAEARSTFEEAIAEGERMATRWGLPETLCAYAQCLLEVNAGDTSGAETALRRAVSLAHRQGSLLMEMRAVARLGELMLDQGDRQAALEVIETPLASLSATAPPEDVRRAQAVLLAAS